MPSNPAVWFELYVDDMARARAFYEQVLQVEFTPLAMPGLDMLCFPGSGEGAGAGGALVRQPGMPAGGAGTVVYFGCADCAVELARVEAAGGRIRQPKFSLGEHGAAALFIDTEGNTVGLHSQE